MTQLQTERDYINEAFRQVGEYLDSHTSVISAEAAAELMVQWDSTGLLDGWLRARALQILTDYISDVSRTRGANRPREARLAKFREFSDEFEETLNGQGPEAARDRAVEFFKMHEVTEDGRLVRKRLGDLNASQLGEVRDKYRRRASENEFKGRVMEAVLKRVAAAGPDATVGSVYTPEQVEKMFERGDQ